MTLVNGQPESTIKIVDRGLQYGDGLFETIAFRNGQAEFLQQHLQRLENDCQRLSIPYQQIAEQLQTELALVCSELTADTVIKIILTRGQGGRGYRSDGCKVPTRIISTHPFPVYPATHQQGIKARICQQAISINSATAGIKHLNRLDQVLARAEWNDDDIAEGIMFNDLEQLIDGTMTNVFIVKQQQLLTPKLTLSGVAGIMRQQVINCAERAGHAVIYADLTLNDLLAADEVFVTNSIINIWPITTIGTSCYQHGPITKQLQNLLKKLTL
ncbi:aminodeoxychorismate lyase [Methylophaga sp. 41_12_T18]|nr:aminodeoxychorismate lyase [Methylophaga sp. 41_12_T18]